MSPVISMSFKPWKSSKPPKRILIIRLQAVGDTLFTLPFVQLIRNQYPNAQIDFLTRTTQIAILENIAAINTTIEFDNSHRLYKQFLEVIRLGFKLFFKRYGVIFDLQNIPIITRPLRWFLLPKAWAEFDVYGADHIFNRNWRTIQKINLVSAFEHHQLVLKNPDLGIHFLKENGWDGASDLVVLNPAGAFPSRHWEQENYVSFAKIWKEKYPKTQFLVLGDERILEKAHFFQTHLGNDLINLAGKTTLSEAFAITAKVHLMISEDSGLIPIAWCHKIPTVALIGSTHIHRSTHSDQYITALHSDDLPCGNCMKPDCQFGEIPPCLSRYTPAMIVGLAEKLLKKN